jgi:hypothetical protein
MLRSLLLALIAANLLFWAWAQSWLAPGLPGPQAGQREPQRLASQVQPEWVRVLPASAASAGMAAAREAAALCLEAGPLEQAALAAAQAALSQLPLAETRWTVAVDSEGRSWLRVDRADAVLQAQLKALPAQDLGGGFRPCRAS